MTGLRFAFSANVRVFLAKDLLMSDLALKGVSDIFGVHLLVLVRLFFFKREYSQINLLVI